MFGTSGHPQLMNRFLAIFLIWSRIQDPIPLRASEFVFTHSRLSFLEPNFWTTRWGCVCNQHHQGDGRPVDFKVSTKPSSKIIAANKTLESHRLAP